MWRIIKQYGAKPTHEGAEKVFTILAPDMERYASEVRDIMDEVWDNEGYHKWAPHWAGLCDIPQATLEARRQAYEESRVKVRNQKVSLKSPGRLG